MAAKTAMDEIGVLLSECERLRERANANDAVECSRLRGVIGQQRAEHDALRRAARLSFQRELHLLGALHELRGYLACKRIEDADILLNDIIVAEQGSE
ncbi:MAG: hypothetical protein HKM89_10765, partial [Gemmatimonadales bacterium]|nr:hypothetical protein [Gemmatimonadales bacterium]